MFPKILGILRQHMRTYNDKHKQWLKYLLNNVAYFKELEEGTVEDLVYSCEKVYYPEGYQVLRQNELPTGIYILIKGTCQAYLKFRKETI